MGRHLFVILLTFYLINSMFSFVSAAHFFPVPFCLVSFAAPGFVVPDSVQFILRTPGLNNVEDQPVVQDIPEQKVPGNVFLTSFPAVNHLERPKDGIILWPFFHNYVYLPQSHRTYSRKGCDTVVQEYCCLVYVVYHTPDL